MNDEEFESQKQRIRELAETWINALGLAWWDIDLAYARDDYEEPPNASSLDRSLAHCSADWRYGHACITWNMVLVREQPDDKLEGTFVHELMHIFLNETRETGDDWLAHEERVASTLTKAFLWQRQALQSRTTE